MMFGFVELMLNALTKPPSGRPDVATFQLLPPSLLLKSASRGPSSACGLAAYNAWEFWGSIARRVEKLTCTFFQLNPAFVVLKTLSPVVYITSEFFESTATI